MLGDVLKCARKKALAELGCTRRVVCDTFKAVPVDKDGLSEKAQDPAVIAEVYESFAAAVVRDTADKEIQQRKYRKSTGAGEDELKKEGYRSFYRDLSPFVKYEVVYGVSICGFGKYIP